MASPFECPVCEKMYDFEAERHPMMLLCGHSLCLLCISDMDAKACPCCLLPFTTQFPNTTLRDIMLAGRDINLAAALASEALRAKTEAEEQIRANEFYEKMRAQREEEEKVRAREEVEEQIRSMPEKEAAVKLKIISMDEFVKGAEDRFETARLELKRARGNADGARKELIQLRASLSRLTKSLGVAGSDPEGHPDAAVADPSTVTDPLDTRANLGSQQVVLVESSRLEDLMEQMCWSNAPDIYDLQGKELQMLDNTSPDIKTTGVTLRNGTIQLFEDQYLSISGTDVTLESMVITGGRQGVWVHSDSSLIMIGCEVRNCKVGIEMSALYGSSLLELKLVKVVDCIDAFHLRGKSVANLTDCYIGASTEGYVDCGIKIEEESSMVGTRVRITGVRSDVLFLRDAAKLSLTDCSLKGNSGALQFISGKAAVKYYNCDLDDKSIQQEPNKIAVKA